ncbi:hypothetical protein B7494_g2163 [Chlorociboria aeruginascens]|nr:hypothetical protein B7494_g2163 [Chlorociboria aeruginascens]
MSTLDPGGHRRGRSRSPGGRERERSRSRVEERETSRVRTTIDRAPSPPTRGYEERDRERYEYEEETTTRRTSRDPRDPRDPRETRDSTSQYEPPTSTYPSYAIPGAYQHADASVLDGLKGKYGDRREKDYHAEGGYGSGRIRGDDYDSPTSRYTDGPSRYSSQDTYTGPERRDSDREWERERDARRFAEEKHAKERGASFNVTADHSSISGGVNLSHDHDPHGPYPYDRPTSPPSSAAGAAYAEEYAKRSYAEPKKWEYAQPDEKITYTRHQESNSDPYTARPASPPSHKSRHASYTGDSARSSKSNVITVEPSSSSRLRREASPNPGMTGRMHSLSVSTGHHGGASMSLASAPGSPLLESYHGTYQSISPMPSPLMIASTSQTDVNIIEPLSPNFSSDEDRRSGPKKSKRTARFHDPVDEAALLAKALKGEKHAPDTDPLIEILPGLTHEQVLDLRVEYKRIVKTGSEKKGVNIAKHIKLRLKDEDPNLMKACYACALGKWESEAYWANFWYQGEKSRRELLIESLMGRTNHEIAEIKEGFSDKKYSNSLTKCMKMELKEDKFKKAVLLVLEERKMDESEHVRSKEVEEDVRDLYRAVKSEKGGETAMINIVVVRSDRHMREVLRLYESTYRANFAREMLRKSGNLVGELLAHILNGIINKPVRDALLIHHALSLSKSDGLRTELLISRLVRYHWDRPHMEEVKREYAARYGVEMRTAVREGTRGEWGRFLEGLCVRRMGDEVREVERVRVDEKQDWKFEADFMAQASGLPYTAATWQATLTRTEAVPEGEGKRSEQQASASKIELEQFLRLRVLWRVQGISKLNSYQHGVPKTALEQALSQLNELDPWQEYLRCVERGQLSGPLSQKLGVFALVLKHQREVKKVVPEVQEDNRYNLRKQQEVLYPSEPEGTPVRSSTTREFLGKDLPSTPITQTMQSLQDFSFTPQTPLAKARALDIEMFPENPDEQIVNTALINFLEAITIHLPCPAYWSLHRKAFRIEKFEARVDGYLAQEGTGHIKAIIEVKAALRNRQEYSSRVRMQEGAQMAAWIFTDKKEEGCFIIDQQAGRRRRILISQDRHQIFLTFADYGIEILRNPYLDVAQLKEHGIWASQIDLKDAERFPRYFRPASPEKLASLEDRRPEIPTPPQPHDVDYDDGGGNRPIRNLSQARYKGDALGEQLTTGKDSTREWPSLLQATPWDYKRILGKRERSLLGGSMSSPVEYLQEWELGPVFEIPHNHRPHMFCVLHQGVDIIGPLLRTEVLTIVGVILERMRLRLSETHLIFPIIMVSMIGTQGRIIQAHYDGDNLYIQYSELYEFKNFDKDNIDLFLRWMMTEPIGDTAILAPEEDKKLGDGVQGRSGRSLIV